MPPPPQSLRQASRSKAHLQIQEQIELLQVHLAQGEFSPEFVHSHLETALDLCLLAVIERRREVALT
jgi:hypothetical protein